MFPRAAVFPFWTLLLASTVSAQTVRNIALPVKVSEEAVDTFVQQQWVRQGWSSFSGAVAGCPYTIRVPSPTVRFTTGHGTLTLGIEVVSTGCGGGPWNFTLHPTIAIPSGQITAPQIKMWLVDLYDLIDGLAVPQWVKDALFRELADRWGVPDLADAIDAFPAPLLTGLTTHWFDQRSANLYYSDPFQLAWQVEDGFLKLVPSVNIQAGQGATITPEFKARLYLGNTDWIDIWANIKAKVKTVRLYDLGANHKYTRSPGVSTIKYHGDPANEWIMINLNGTELGFNQFYIAWILFETDDTFYLRKYKIWSNSSGWTGATQGRYN